MNTSNQARGQLLSLINDVARLYAYQMCQARDWSKAEILLKGILDDEPGDAWSIALYGSMLRDQGRYRDGLALLEQAAALAPQDTNISTMRDELRRHLNQSH